MEAPLGKPEGVFHDSIPGENGVASFSILVLQIHYSGVGYPVLHASSNLRINLTAPIALA
jgi:hypothetical protein